VFYNNGSELERYNYAADGKLKYHKKFYEGSRFCEWKYYKRSGMLMEKICYENHQRVDTSLVYFETGVLKQQFIYENGKMNGEYALYHDAGRLQEKSMYVDGKQQGYYIKYYYNGNRELSKTMKDGIMVDSCFYYYPTGQVSTSMYFNENGDLEGEYKSYYRSGQLRERATYVGHDNLRDGKVISFYEDGQVESEGQYDEGAKVGRWTYYRTDGEIDHEMEYGNKDRTFYIQYNYDEAGKLVSKEKIEEE
jgi:antitoxin component YwqK of YwqJK toxin-antitoxin module